MSPKPTVLSALHDSPSRTKPVNIANGKPCASMIASVQPCGAPASSLSAQSERPALLGTQARCAHRHRTPVRLSRAGPAMTMTSSVKAVLPKKLALG
jgi:hypothetical protein